MNDQAVNAMVVSSISEFLVQSSDRDVHIPNTHHLGPGGRDRYNMTDAIGLPFAPLGVATFVFANPPDTFGLYHGQITQPANWEHPYSQLVWPYDPYSVVFQPNPEHQQTHHTLDNVVWAYPISSFSPRSTEEQFNEYAAKWYKETRRLSFVHQKAMHPAYQRIIGMGDKTLPFIFRELQQTHDHWMWALAAITGTDPTTSGQSYAHAVDTWLRWGEQHGYIS
jgi:hypothetical protein